MMDFGFLGNKPRNSEPLSQCIEKLETDYYGLLPLVQGAALAGGNPLAYFRSAGPIQPQLAVRALRSQKCDWLASAIERITKLFPNQELALSDSKYRNQVLEQLTDIEKERVEEWIDEFEEAYDHLTLLFGKIESQLKLKAA